jgi:hypothetical protein
MFVPCEPEHNATGHNRFFSFEVVHSSPGSTQRPPFNRRQNLYRWQQRKTLCLSPVRSTSQCIPSSWTSLQGIQCKYKYTMRYIDYEHFCNAVKWRVAKMRHLIDETFRNVFFTCVLSGFVLHRRLTIKDTFAYPSMSSIIRSLVCGTDLDNIVVYFRCCSLDKESCHRV